MVFEKVPFGNPFNTALKAYNNNNNNNNNNTHTLVNTIINNPLVLKYGLKDLLDWVKDSYIERDINLIY